LNIQVLEEGPETENKENKTNRLRRSGKNHSIKEGKGAKRDKAPLFSVGGQRGGGVGNYLYSEDWNGGLWTPSVWGGNGVKGKESSLGDPTSKADPCWTKSTREHRNKIRGRCIGERYCGWENIRESLTRDTQKTRQRKKSVGGRDLAGRRVVQRFR